MNKVTTANLGGRAYQFEEEAYALLRGYLGQAASSLASNPDKDEILTDLERAIADKCEARLSRGKNVISGKEAEEIIKEMGPVEGDGAAKASADAGAGAGQDASETAGPSAAPRAPKRLYRIREGEAIAGVCNGLAAYLDVDVTIVRVAFVALAILTGGAWVVFYIVLAFVIPPAVTPAERAQASGAAPVTAQDLIGRARKRYEDFKDSKEWHRWKKQMKDEARRWKHEWRDQRRAWRAEQDCWARDHKDRACRRGPIAELVHVVIELAQLLVIVYLVWLAYGHFPSVREFLDAVGAFLSHVLSSTAAWLRSR